MHQALYVIFYLFCSFVIAKEEIDINPQPLLGNYYRDYTWGRIASSDGQLCLQEEKNQVWFKKCEPEATISDVDEFAKELKQHEFYSQYWIHTNEQLRSLTENGQAASDCIDLPSEKHGKEGTVLKRKGCNDTLYQRWKLVHAKGHGEDALFMLRARDPRAKNQCLDMNFGKKPVHIWSCDKNNPNQTFKLMPSFAQLRAKSPHPYDAFPEAALKEFSIDTPNWMHQIYEPNPDTKLKDIIIPGTHDSGTFTGFSVISKTQSLSILGQLEAGIRYIDLRLGADDKIVHGIENGPQGSITRAIKDIANFANEHQQEIIFVDIHELPQTSKDLHFIADLINNNLSPRLQPSAIRAENNTWNKIDVNEITFRYLWQNDKNIILLVRNWYALSRLVTDYKTWNKSLGITIHNNDSNNHSWEEVWPDETNFKVIYQKNTIALSFRNPNKWHMSQLVRTPKQITAIVTIFGFFGGIKELELQTTNDGNFNFGIGKWIYNWAEIYQLPTNFFHTDFFENSQLVPMAIWLNIKRKAQL